MNDPRPAFLFHVRDFWTSEAVELMNFEEIGLYLFLLGRQWETGSIPADANALRTLCRRNATDLDAALRTVLRCFEDVGNGRLQNRRLEFERARLDQKSGKARDSAKARWDAFKAAGGGAKADHMRTHSERIADAERSQCDGNASEGKGREEKGIQPPCDPPSPGGAPIEQAPKRTKRRPDPGWESVLTRPAYAALRAEPLFNAAWTLWIEHTRTAGAKAREPSATSAAAILNAAARHGAARFAAAVEASIAGNWQGIHYPDVRGGASSGSRHATKTDAGIALVFEQAGIKFPGATDVQ